jgi:2,3-bisphosphoglycerate-dependent phosphoglycerate mutase
MLPSSIVLLNISAMLLLSSPSAGLLRMMPSTSRIATHRQRLLAPTILKASFSEATTTLPTVPSGAHRVVFMRHAESEFNNANIFTGWCDVALTRRGVVEAIEAGQVFYSHRMHFRKCYSSLLTRSIVTAQRALETAGLAYTPMHMDW